MAIDVIFGIIGGLGIFIYGMYIMSDSLKKLTLSRLKSLLEKITSNRFNGVLVGLGVTALIQSSSATSVILIGFLNAGLITLQKAIPVILGANIGTTITAQLIAFKLTHFAPLFIAGGSFVFFFGKKNKMKKIGLAILGFGLLFLGLSMMSDAVKPLSGSESIKNMFVQFGSMPILGILLGLFITVLLQSSSTTIGIVIALAIAGLIDFNIAFYLILGDNIGTCITAVIASVNGNKASKQLALGHTMFNVIGVVIACFLFPLYQHFIPMLSPGDLTRQIANTHSAFNIINTLLFLPFITYYIKFIKSVIKGEDYAQKEIQYLDKNLLESPPLALSAVKKEIGVMLDITHEMLVKVHQCFKKFSHKKFQEILIDEDSVDNLEKSITAYLIEISRKELEDDTSRLAQILISNVKDVERIGDHCENMLIIAQKKYEDDVIFTEHANAELEKIYTQTLKMLKLSKKGLAEDDNASAKEALKVKMNLNALIVEAEKKHMKRLKSKQCENIAGHLFSDFMIHFGRITEHLENISEA